MRRSARPIPTRRTSRPVTTGRTARAASAKPAAEATAGPVVGAPSPWLPYPTTAAAAARNASVGHPTGDPPVRVHGPRAATHRTYPARTAPTTLAPSGAMPGSGSATNGAGDEDDQKAEDRGPGVLGRTGDEATDHDRERDPRKGRVYGSGLMERRAPAPGRSESEGCRRR